MPSMVDNDSISKLTPSELKELYHLSPARDYFSSERASALLNTMPHKTQRTYLWRNPGAGVVIICETEQGAYIVRAKRFDNTWKSTFGGAVEAGESFLEAALRETQEEWFHTKLGDFQLQDYIHLNRGRRLQDGRIRGFDYVTGVVVIKTTFAELSDHISALKKHASHALAALAAFIKTDAFLSESHRSRKVSAQYGLEDPHVLQCIAAHKGGLDAIETLEQIAAGDIVFNPVDKMLDQRTHAIMHFTEYSDFEIVPVENALEVLYNAEAGITLTEVFKLDPFSVSGLICKYINGKFSL
ncbi:MAG: hypothetical protein CMD81_05205 [Gammaproteobacteria bacterium]|nr:hypothetical protein [Gammaproteobacteria bacterium]HBF09578.1 hypothetical protein [Gammaproteobacteria bacterium]|tara:strand:- start:545 stop:1441 length:897 start_codon:yes stop_codon:yes gene_type:complete